MLCDVQKSRNEDVASEEGRLISEGRLILPIIYDLFERDVTDYGTVGCHHHQQH